MASDLMMRRREHHFLGDAFDVARGTTHRRRALFSLAMLAALVGPGTNIDASAKPLSTIMSAPPAEDAAVPGVPRPARMHGRWLTHPSPSPVARALRCVVSAADVAEGG